MPIQLPYTLSQVDLSNLPDAIDSSGDIIGKALGAQILDENFLRLAKVVNVSETAPVEVFDGMLWLDTTENIIKMWNGGQWISRTDLTNRIVASMDVPTNPKLGGAWFDLSVKQLKIWDGEAWVSVSENVSSIAGEVPNGSFEFDSNNDGIPDGWTRVLYQGGSGGFDTSNPIHGSRCYRFTHPGDTNNGGGYLESGFIAISELISPVVEFYLRCSTAGMKNIVKLHYFNASKVHIGEEDIYNSTSNPTSWTRFTLFGVPPTGTRYMKVVLISGFTDTGVAGSIFWDAVTVNPFPTTIFTSFTMSEASTTSPTWVDLTSTTIRIPKGFTWLHHTVYIIVHSDGAWASGGLRTRILDNYSSYLAGAFVGVGGTINNGSVTISVSGLSGTNTIYLQGIANYPGITTFVGKLDPYAMFIRF